MGNCKGWFQRKVADPFWSYLQQGAEPRVLARSAAVGFNIGLCPLVGVSTGITVVVLLITRSYLHGPMTLLANLVALPADIALVLPFMRLGEVLLQAPYLPVTPVSIKDIVFNHPGDALKGLGHAVLGWVVCFPLSTWLTAIVLRPVFAVLQRRLERRRLDGSLEVLLEEDACSVSSNCDDRNLRRSGSMSPGPPLRGRSARGQSAGDSIV
ncbi:g11346 [Coccomyxa elongata]